MNPKFALDNWPMLAWEDGTLPTESSKHGDENSDRPDHRGSDIMLPFLEAHEDVAPPEGDGGRAARFWVPLNMPIVATNDGIVKYAEKIETGLRCWVLHDGFRTGYFHLAHLAVRDGQIVRAGDILGLCGHNPVDRDAIHLHFAMSTHPKYKTFNTGPYLRACEIVIPWFPYEQRMRYELRAS